MRHLRIENRKSEIENRANCTRAFSLGVLFVLAGCLLGGCAGPVRQNAILPYLWGSGNTKPVVKIGLVAPFEGLYRHLGYDVLYAVKLAVRERNAAGGVGGYMVELVALDDGNDPAQAPLQARKMVVDTDVMGVIGHFSDETALAALDEYHRAGLAMITQVAASEVTERGYPEVFRIYACNEVLGAAAARYAVQELEMHRLAVLRGRDDLAAAFIQTAEQLGATVVLDADYTFHASRFTFYVSRFTSTDLIFFSGGAVEGVELIAQARKAGIEAIFMGGSEFDCPQLTQIGGETVGGTLYVSAAPRSNSGDVGQDAILPFVTGYQILAGRLPGPQAIMAYDATRVLLEALAEAIASQGRPSRDAVIRALDALQDYPGLIGPITFDGQGDLVEPKTYVYRVEF